MTSAKVKFLLVKSRATQLIPMENASVRVLVERFISNRLARGENIDKPHRYYGSIDMNWLIKCCQRTILGNSN